MNERLHTKVSIIAQQRDELSKVVKERKELTTGSRKNVKGKHIMTALELKLVRDAEKKTKEKKQKRGSNQPNEAGEVGIVMRNDIETMIDHVLEDMAMVDDAISAED
jgi:hypothetical protein